MNLKRHIPNFLTCINLLLGCIGIIYVFQQNLTMAAYFIWLAAIIDFFDGFFARLLKAFSEIGKELDSLADMVSFGLLPAFIMFNLISQSTGLLYLPYIALLIAVFSALRLAKFNIDPRQADTFIGLPTPANAIFMSSLPLIISSEYFLNHFLLNPLVLISITVVFSLLLVAELPLFSLKFKSFNWKENKIIYSFIALSMLFVIFLKILAIPIIIMLYILISVIDKILKK